MIALGQLPGVLLAVEPTIWGEAVRQAMPKLKTIVVSGAKDHFRFSTSPDGKPWAPLAHPRPGGGDKPLRDKGLLMASLSATENQSGLTLSASSPGANVHQFGATITAKSAKFLAIPLSREAKRAGSPRLGFPAGRLFVMRVNERTAYLAESKEKGRKGNKHVEFTFHYVLKRSVTIPARPFVGFSRPTLDKVTQILWDTYYKRLWDAIAKAQSAYYAANPLIG